MTGLSAHTLNYPHKTGDGGLLVNATRSIIYASNGKDFAEKARAEALKLQQEMSVLLKQNNSSKT